MWSLHPDRVDALARIFFSHGDWEHLQELQVADEGYGYDAFGAHPAWMRLGYATLKPLYDVWFRVSSSGAMNIPDDGGAILVSNHSGALPFDAMMLACDVGMKTSPPRPLRVAVDHFVPRLPLVSVFYWRVGAIGGSRENVRHLLERGELIGLFPEGVPGIGKRFSERYQIRTWREGHAELAIRHRVPVIPTAVIGAEEQMPQLARIPLPKQTGVPYFPLTLTPFPLPVKYHIYYGEPIDLFSDTEPNDARNPELVHERAERVREAVQALIARGLEERRGVFG